MKVLTIKEPWATLIISGYKKYEFRTWKTKYRGKILIHAGISLEKDLLEKIDSYNLNFSKGAIIGEATLVDCILVDEELNKELKKINPIVYGRSNHLGTYAWKLEDIKKYDEPICIKGKLGLWNYEGGMNMEKRMTKDELIKLMNSLNIDKDEFWVLSSSALVLRDLFPDAGDLDIAVTKKGLEQLQKNFDLKQKENGWYTVNDKVECVLQTKEDWKYEKFDNYNLESLTKYFEYLKSSTREKDKIRYEIVKKQLENK